MARTSQHNVKGAGVALLMFLLLLELQEMNEPPVDASPHHDTSTRHPLPKVFVAVYSGGSNNSEAVSKADARAGRAVNTLRERNRDAIVATWADNNTFFVTSEQVASPRVIRLPKDVESGGYNGLIAKTEASWKYIYEHFVDDYDWFMKVGKTSSDVCSALHPPAPLSLCSPLNRPSMRLEGTDRHFSSPGRRRHIHQHTSSPLCPVSFQSGNPCVAWPDDKAWILPRGWRVHPFSSFAKGYRATSGKLS